jgi:hypothetical protein
VDGERSEAFDGVEQTEVVEGVIVLAEARALEPVREGPSQFVTVAAVAATGFFAGAATAAVLGRRMSRVGARRGVGGGGGAAALPARPHERYEVVSSRRYVVDVHTVATRR